MLTLDHIQQVILAQTTTNPTYLVDIEWDGATQHWSTQGEHVVDGTTYTAGQIGVRGSDNWRSATLALNPSAAHTTAMMAGDWVGGSCTISLLPIREHPQIVDDGYFEDGYGFFGTEVGDPITLLIGVLSAAEYSGNGPISLSVRNVGTTGRWAPRARLTPPICNHLPAPGTKFSWAGEVYILEGR